MYAMTYGNPLVTRHPIHNGNFHYTLGTLVTEKSIIYECNENILLRYVYRALADHNMLSGKLIRKSELAGEFDPEPEKTYTVEILGRDIGLRENRVMFANSDEVLILLNMLKKEVTYERMHMIKGSIGSNEPDDINKLGSKFLAKWRKNENWPF